MDRNLSYYMWMCDLKWMHEILKRKIRIIILAWSRNNFQAGARRPHWKIHTQKKKTNKKKTTTTENQNWTQTMKQESYRHKHASHPRRIPCVNLKSISDQINERICAFWINCEKRDVYEHRQQRQQHHQQSLQILDTQKRSTPTDYRV